MRRVVLPIILLLIGIYFVITPPDLVTAGRERARVNLRAPAGDRPTQIDPAGETVLPNGRLLTPAGVQVTVDPHPYGLALSPDGKTLVTANIGPWPFSLSVIRNLDSKRPVVTAIPRINPPQGAEIEPSSVFHGPGDCQ